VETFVEPIEMVEESRFTQNRIKALGDLRPGEIDPQILDIVQDFLQLPHCYTVQSCCGHFVVPGDDGQGVTMLDPGPRPPETGLYQLAYVAVVIENSGPGRELYHRLSEFPKLSKAFIQWGSATWFWNEQGYLNSYVLQVEPVRFKHLDRFTMDEQEARDWLAARELFWTALRGMLRRESAAKPAAISPRSKGDE
jgi:hypothetical protein